MTNFQASLLIFVACICPTFSWAQDINDEATDIEEIRAESTAVKSILKTTEQKVNRQQSENDKKFKQIRSQRDQAASRRDKLQDQLKTAEDKLTALENEETTIRADMEKIATETAAIEQSLRDDKLKKQEAESRNADLKAQRDESRKKLKELQKQQAQLVRQSAAAEDRTILVERETQSQIEREQEAIKDLEKSKAEYVSEKVLLDQRVLAIRQKLKSLKARKARMQREIADAKASSYRLREEVKTGDQVVNQVQDSIDNQVTYDESSDR